MVPCLGAVDEGGMVVPQTQYFTPYHSVYFPAAAAHPTQLMPQQLPVVMSTLGQHDSSNTGSDESARGSKASKSSV